MQKIAIVGFGFMGGMHAQVYARLRAARVVAIVDENVAGARAKARELQLDVPIFQRIELALRDEPIDVVDICLPTPAHLPAIRVALDAGKAVFCEKPLARSAQDASKIAGWVKRAGKPFQVGHCIRFWPEYQTLEWLVKNRPVGHLLSLSLQRRAARPKYSADDWLNDARRSGGAALDLHIHDTDFVHHLLGKPTAVTSVGTGDLTGWSHIFTTYHFPDVAVTAEGGWNYPEKFGFKMAFQALFEYAAVDYDSSRSPALTVSVQGGRRVMLPRNQERVGNSKLKTGNISSLGGYYNELKYFIDALERKQPIRIATAAQAAESVATVMAEIKSAETGRTVRLRS